MCLGVPGRVDEIWEEQPRKEQPAEQVAAGRGRTAKVNFSGVVREVQMDFVPEAQVGDYVIVHVGVALSKLDEAAAKETLEMLAELQSDELQSNAEGDRQFGNPKHFGVRKSNEIC